MNRSQKLLQPLIDRQRERKNEGGFAGGHSLGVLDGLEEAQRALTALSCDIMLDDAPAVEWADTWGFQYSKYTHGEYVVKEMVNDNGPEHVIQLLHKGESLGYWSSARKAKRYVEIRIHLDSNFGALS